MKRDWDLVQEILKAYEEDNSFNQDTIPFENVVQSKDRDDEINEARYHHAMLEEAGCLAPLEKSVVSNSLSEKQYLTMKGHDLLEQLRGDEDLSDAPRSRQY